MLRDGIIVLSYSHWNSLIFAILKSPMPRAKGNERLLCILGILMMSRLEIAST